MLKGSHAVHPINDLNSAQFNDPFCAIFPQWREVRFAMALKFGFCFWFSAFAAPPQLELGSWSKVGYQIWVSIVFSNNELSFWVQYLSLIVTQIKRAQEGCAMNFLSLLRTESLSFPLTPPARQKLAVICGLFCQLNCFRHNQTTSIVNPGPTGLGFVDDHFRC